MAPTVLKEFSLSIDIEEFMTIFWMDNTPGAFYETFLVEKLEDLDVCIGEWVEEAPNVKARQIKSYHPSKISFPGLPSHAEVLLHFIYSC